MVYVLLEQNSLFFKTKTTFYTLYATVPLPRSQYFEVQSRSYSYRTSLYQKGLRCLTVFDGMFTALKLRQERDLGNLLLGCDAASPYD